ncbi:MAG: beta-ketoacyl-ACP synthase 3, partial [Bacteroidales bacterium]|nr:beta-ketoacyl-ACP synthase 3 [Bacteroidales bacterium]
MKIIGTGSALPRKIVTNDMIAEYLDTSDEWIYPRTGIKSRHVITDEKLEDLGAEAVNKALEMSGLGVSDIDLFIVSNVVSEYGTPGISCIVAEKVGLTCPMFDINCACPGFVYALDMAEAYYKAGKVRNVLIACIEEPTRMASWDERSTCILFGDGAGAVVLGEGDNIKGTRLRSEPAVDKIWMTRSLTDTPYVKNKLGDVPMQMKGRDVFRFAVNACTKGVKELLDEVGIEKKDVSWFMVHQANKRILDAIIDYMKVPAQRCPVNIEDHGNSSSASCPILLDECNRKGM